MDIENEIRELKEKALKWEHLKGRYIQIAERLREIENLIKDLIKDVEPYQAIKSRKGKRNWQSIIEELYKAMEMGIGINKEYIEKTYPELTTPETNNLLSGKIRKMARVETAKNGRKTTYFIRKNVR